MIVQCAVCESPIESDEAYERLESSVEEEPVFFCSERCLRAFEEEPERFSGDGLADGERPSAP